MVLRSAEEVEAWVVARVLVAAQLRIALYIAGALRQLHPLLHVVMQ